MKAFSLSISSLGTFVIAFSLAGTACVGSSQRSVQARSATEPVAEAPREPWHIQPGSRAEKIAAGDPVALLSEQMFGFHSDLRYAATSWKWAFAVPPPSLNDLLEHRLLLRRPLRSDGSAYVIASLAAGQEPAPDVFGVSCTDSGFELIVLNPEESLRSERPTGRLATNYAKEWAVPFPYEQLAYPVAKRELEDEIRESEARGEQRSSPAGLASKVGGNKFTWSSNQLNERRLIAFQHAIWGMFEAHLRLHGQMPTDWDALCREQGWELTDVRTLASGELPHPEELAFALQCYQDGRTMRMLLKPTADVFDFVVYQYDFYPQTGQFQRTLLDVGPEDEAGWRDLIRVALPTDPLPISTQLDDAKVSSRSSDL